MQLSHVEVGGMGIGVWWGGDGMGGCLQSMSHVHESRSDCQHNGLHDSLFVHVLLFMLFMITCMLYMMFFCGIEPSLCSI